MILQRTSGTHSSSWDCAGTFWLVEHFLPYASVEGVSGESSHPLAVTVSSMDSSTREGLGSWTAKKPRIHSPGQKLSLHWRQNLKPDTPAATQREMCTSLTRWFSHFTVCVTYDYTFQKLTFLHTRCLYLKKIIGKKLNIYILVDTVNIEKTFTW